MAIEIGIRAYHYFSYCVGDSVQHSLSRIDHFLQTPEGRTAKVAINAILFFGSLLATLLLKWRYIRYIVLCYCIQTLLDMFIAPWTRSQRWSEIMQRGLTMGLAARVVIYVTQGIFQTLTLNLYNGVLKLSKGVFLGASLFFREDWDQNDWVSIIVEQTPIKHVLSRSGSLRASLRTKVYNKDRHPLSSRSSAPDLPSLNTSPVLTPRENYSGKKPIDKEESKPDTYDRGDNLPQLDDQNTTLAQYLDCPTLNGCDQPCDRVRINSNLQVLGANQSQDQDSRNFFLTFRRISQELKRINTEDIEDVKEELFAEGVYNIKKLSSQIQPEAKLAGSFQSRSSDTTIVVTVNIQSLSDAIEDTSDVVLLQITTTKIPGGPTQRNSYESAGKNDTPVKGKKRKDSFSSYESAHYSTVSNDSALDNTLSRLEMRGIGRYNPYGSSESDNASTVSSESVAVPFDYRHPKNSLFPNSQLPT